MKDNYKFKIIDGRTITYDILDNNDEISSVIDLNNRKDLINIQLTADNIIRGIEFTFINRSIDTNDIDIKKDDLTKKEFLKEFQTPDSSNYLLNYSNNNLNIVLSTEDNRIRSYYEDGTMTYYFNEKNELVMLGKVLGKEEKEYFEYIHSPLPITEPSKVIEEISNREGINILEASFLGDESWESEMVNSYYQLRFIYDDKDKPEEITYPYEKNVDIKGIGVRELFKRLENDDLEAYETLHSGYRLLTNDYISEIRQFTRNNIHYNNILRKYLGIQKRILEEIKEGDVIPTGLFIDFIRRAQLMRSIEFYNRYPLMTYEYTFEDGYPYIGDLTSLKDKLLEYRKENPMIEIDKDKIKLMEHLTNYTVPEEDNNYDVAARDELLSKADDLSKKLQRKI